MIIRSVVVHNFGVFRGRQQIDFAPTSSERPIVLIGAMNGSGKTTLLEALKLALFGRRATDLSRGSRSYEEFLSGSVNRDVPTTDGASVEVEFTVLSAGRDCTYRVIRSWSGVNGQLKESFEVYLDTVFDPVLSDGWSEHVESILPVRLAPFFFFDGERLETLADLGKARDFLANAIEALLGLDIVDRLGDDLRSVERRIKEGAVDSPKDSEEMAKLRAQVEISDREVMHLVQRCGELTNMLEQARRAAQHARRDLEAISGDLPQRMLALQKERSAFSARRSDAMAKLTQLAYEAGPLILLKDKLQDALSHAAPDDLEPGKLAERDEHLLAMMKGDRIPNEILSRLQFIMSQDVAQRLAKSSSGNGATRAALGESSHAARRAEDEARGSIAALDSFDAELARIDAQIKALPTPQSLEPLERASKEKDAVVTATEAQCRSAMDSLERARKLRDRAESQMQEIFAVATEQARLQRYAVKLVSRSNDLRRTLDLFRTHMAAQHAARLGETILEAFQCLHRKVGTIERIVVDSRTFEMTLFDGAGRHVDPARLSAGERQLLAVAMVWAILKAAGRPLPLWIDTPLGRLDSLHRRHLVERFFPFAAPQVVLLSTDTEIDRSAFEALAPHVSRSYRFEFDPATRSSRTVDGYFLEHAA